MRKKKTPAEKLVKRDNRPQLLAKAKKPDLLSTDIQRGKALDLFLEHKSYRTIARELGISIDTAFKWVNHEYEQRLAANTEKANLVRERQSAQYDELIERWMPLALSEDLNVGEKRVNKKGEEYDVSLQAWEASTAASTIVLKAMEGKAKIHGLQLTKIEMKADPIAQDLFKQVQGLVDSMTEKKADAIEV